MADRPLLCQRQHLAAVMRHLDAYGSLEDLYQFGAACRATADLVRARRFGIIDENTDTCSKSVLAFEYVVAISINDRRCPLTAMHEAHGLSGWNWPPWSDVVVMLKKILSRFALRFDDWGAQPLRVAFNTQYSDVLIQRLHVDAAFMYPDNVQGYTLDAEARFIYSHDWSEGPDRIEDWLLILLKSDPEVFTAATIRVTVDESCRKQRTPGPLHTHQLVRPILRLCSREDGAAALESAVATKCPDLPLFLFLLHVFSGHPRPPLPMFARYPNGIRYPGFDMTEAIKRYRTNYFYWRGPEWRMCSEIYISISEAVDGPPSYLWKQL